MAQKNQVEPLQWEHLPAGRRQKLAALIGRLAWRRLGLEPAPREAGHDSFGEGKAAAEQDRGSPP